VTWVRALALVAVLRSVLAWSLFSAHLEPDLGLYSSGGWRLFPSPLGTLVGAIGGQDLVVVLSCLAAGGLVLLVGELAGARGALLALLLPIGWLPMFAGIDSIATVLLLASVLAGARWRWPLWLAACGLHLALVPLVAVVAYRKGYRLSVAALASTALAVAAMTPYGAILHRSLTDRFLLAFALTGLIAGVHLLPVVYGLARVGELWLVLGLVAAAALEAGLQQHRQIRYVVPAVLYGLMVSGVRHGFYVPLRGGGNRQRGGQADGWLRLRWRPVTSGTADRP